MNGHHMITAVIVGIGATLITDLWNLFLRHSFHIRSLNFCFLGRWILYMPDGILRHHNISETKPKSFECLTGWLVHYTIGISLTVFFVIIVSDHWLKQPAFFPALFYGICTVVFPLFILQPALGSGMASSKTKNPLQARLKSLMTHLIFGIGLWVSAHAFTFFSA